MFKYQFRWDTVSNNLDFILSGLQLTLLISAMTLVFSMIGGLLIALLDLSKWRALRWTGISISLWASAGQLVRGRKGAMAASFVAADLGPSISSFSRSFATARHASTAAWARL